jgi:lipopolysaccharide biosynthesis glycosyltransferase
MIDGGDIIFQSDISTLFGIDSENIRIATQNMRINMAYIKTHSSFEPATQVEVIKFTLGKSVLNFGVVLGPTPKVIDLCRSAYEMIVDKSRFLIDQMAVNNLLHKNGFVELDKKYNFMKSFYDMRVVNKGGKLYFDNGEIIPIVHNNGGKDWQRPYMNFGYGVEKNKINMISQFISTLIVKLRRKCDGKITF